MKLEQILEAPAIKAAPQLLGWVICRRLQEGVVKIRIVETEAYHQDDPASHSSHGLTKRTAPMFAAGGHIYVYFTYGMHYCINIVTGPAGRGEAVLLRAGEPVEGIEIMYMNRGTSSSRDLINGPGKLAQALGIKDTGLSGKLLDTSSINSGVWLEPPQQAVKIEDIIIGPRVGISRAVAEPMRFYIKDSPWVSRYTGKRAR